MIIDSSALVAIITGETGWEALRDAIRMMSATIPAPTLTEFRLVAAGRGPGYTDRGEALISQLLDAGVEVAAFEQRHADITATAREQYGKGNGRGGQLNFGDLMVYAIAKQRDEPLLCTGRDFATTDLALHPASRLEP